MEDDEKVEELDTLEEVFLREGKSAWVEELVEEETDDEEMEEETTEEVIEEEEIEEDVTEEDATEEETEDDTEDDTELLTALSDTDEDTAELSPSSGVSCPSWLCVSVELFALFALLASATACAHTAETTVSSRSICIASGCVERSIGQRMVQK